MNLTLSYFYSRIIFFWAFSLSLFLFPSHPFHSKRTIEMRKKNHLIENREKNFAKILLNVTPHIFRQVELPSYSHMERKKKLEKEAFIENQIVFFLCVALNCMKWYSSDNGTNIKYKEQNVEQITRVNSILFSIIIFYAKSTTNTQTFG